MKFKTYNERSLWEDIVRDSTGIGDEPKEAAEKADAIVKAYRARQNKEGLEE